jgi:threonine/homoserine/homoserine lactone efflux protein
VLGSVLTFIPAAVLIVLFPGPDTLVVLRSLIRRGRRSAALASVGVVVGLVIWAGAAALGLAALLKASTTAYLVLRIVGAAYLLYIGVQSLRARGNPELSVEHRSLVGDGFRAGLLTDLLNPKVGVFFVSFLPGFIPHGASVGLTSLMLGVIYAAMTGLYFLAMLLISDKVTAWMQNARIRKRMDRVTGVVLIGFGIRLATE